MPVRVPDELVLLIFNHLTQPSYTLRVSGLYRRVCGPCHNVAWSHLSALRLVCKHFNGIWLEYLRKSRLKLHFCDVVFAVPWAFSRINGEVQRRVFEIRVDINGRMGTGTEFSDAVHFAL